MLYVSLEIVYFVDVKVFNDFVEVNVEIIQKVNYLKI